MTTKLSEQYGDALPATLPTCWEKFRSFVDNYPEDLVLVSIHQKATLYGIPNVHLNDETYKRQPYLRWNYRGFATAIDQFATGLQALGVRKGMPLITFVPNGAERLISAFAANRIGCPFTAISPKNLVNMEETAHMIKICLINATADKVVFVAQDPSLVEQIDALPASKDAAKVLVEGPAPARGWTEFAKVMEARERRDGVAHIDDSDHVPNDETVFFTSGTTSLPKGMAQDFS
jgi:acyl-CoA synthetase (AMP-forming)/AMP-acid ligase II